MLVWQLGSDHSFFALTHKVDKQILLKRKRTRGHYLVFFFKEFGLLKANYKTVLPKIWVVEVCF